MRSCGQNALGGGEREFRRPLSSKESLRSLGLAQEKRCSAKKPPKKCQGLVFVALPCAANCDVGVLFLVGICLKALGLLVSWGCTGLLKKSKR